MTPEVIRDEATAIFRIRKKGEAKAIAMGIREHETDQEFLAMLRMLADSSADIKAGRVRDADEVFDSARKLNQTIRNKKTRKGQPREGVMPDPFTGHLNPELRC